MRNLEPKQAAMRERARKRAKKRQAIRLRKWRRGRKASERKKIAVLLKLVSSSMKCWEAGKRAEHGELDNG